MKKRMPAIISLCLIVVSFAFILLGVYLGNRILTYLGVALLFGGMFLVAAAYVIVIFVRARRQADEIQKRISEKQEQAARDDFSDEEQYGREDMPFEQQTAQNKYEEAESMIAHTIVGRRSLPKVQRVLSAIVFVLLIGALVAGMILLSLGLMTPAYICFGCFGGAVLVAVIFAAIVSKRN